MFNKKNCIQAQIVSKELETKHKVEFNFDKLACRSILENVVKRESLKYSCIAGGYFTKLNGQITSPDIYIYTGRSFYPSIDFLNSFLNEEFRSIQFDQLVSRGSLNKINILIKSYFFRDLLPLKVLWREKS